MVKAVFFDVDGTLLSHETHCVPDSTLRALDALREKGILTFLATGRHISTSSRIFCKALGTLKPSRVKILSTSHMALISDREKPLRRIPTRLTALGEPLRDSTIIKGGTSLENTEPPETIAKLPTLQNWWIATLPERIALSCTSL